MGKNCSDLSSFVSANTLVPWQENSNRPYTVNFNGLDVLTPYLSAYLRIKTSSSLAVSFGDLAQVPSPVSVDRMEAELRSWDQSELKI